MDSTKPRKTMQEAYGISEQMERTLQLLEQAAKELAAMSDAIRDAAPGTASTLKVRSVRVLRERTEIRDLGKRGMLHDD